MIWLLWFVPMGIAAVGLGIITWWEMKHATTVDEGQLSLQDIMLGTFVTVCPLINIFIALFAVWFITSQIAPKVIVLGSKT